MQGKRAMQKTPARFYIFRVVKRVLRGLSSRMQEAGRQADRQTDRQTDRQLDRQEGQEAVAGKKGDAENTSPFLYFSRGEMCAAEAVVSDAGSRQASRQTDRQTDS